MQLTIEADSLDTKMAKRDQHLRSLEVEATALVDHRELGTTWSPLGIMRAPSKLIVGGRLIRGEVQR